VMLLCSVEPEESASIHPVLDVVCSCPL
jgi:hypothetical protein